MGGANRGLNVNCGQDDGDLVTSGGVTSGIDLGLWLVQRFAGVALADKVADGLE
jgi:transcriptional regulator GlxA family with amidase domain